METMETSMRCDGGDVLLYTPSRCFTSGPSQQNQHDYRREKKGVPVGMFQNTARDPGPTTTSQSPARLDRAGQTVETHGAGLWAGRLDKGNRKPDVTTKLRAVRVFPRQRTGWEWQRWPIMTRNPAKHSVGNDLCA